MKSDLRRQVGQLLIMGFEEAELSGRMRITMAGLQPGGIVLFARNLVSPVQTWELLRDCRNLLDHPPFLCVDMEGGTVDRMREVVAPAPAAAEVAASGTEKLFRRHGRVIGEECRALGFNTDFAPVLDLGLEPSRKVLGTRSASADPPKVVAYARAFLRGLKDAGVLGCGKHFPGLGEAALDTHHELPAVGKPLKQLWRQDLYPYRQLRRELPMVMVSHAAYPQVSGSARPATLSKAIVTELLRKRIGYRGLVVSDDMEMGALAASAPIAEAAVESLRAGVDMLLVCRDPEKIWAAYEAVFLEAERDRRFAALVAERAKRILAFKRKSKEVQRHAPAPKPEVIDRLRRDLWQLGEQVRLAAISR